MDKKAGGQLIERLMQIAEHDWRVSFLAHTSDTANEAANELAALLAQNAALVEALNPFMKAAEAAERNLADEGGHAFKDAVWTTPNLFAKEGAIHYADLHRAALASSRYGGGSLHVTRIIEDIANCPDRPEDRDMP